MRNVDRREFRTKTRKVDGREFHARTRNVETSFGERPFFFLEKAAEKIASPRGDGDPVICRFWICVQDSLVARWDRTSLFSVGKSMLDGSSENPSLTCFGFLPPLPSPVAKGQKKEAGGTLQRGYPLPLNSSSPPIFDPRTLKIIFPAVVSKAAVAVLILDPFPINGFPLVWMAPGRKPS